MIGVRVQLLEEFREGADAAAWTGYVEAQTNEAALIRFDNGGKVWCKSGSYCMAPDLPDQPANEGSE